MLELGCIMFKKKKNYGNLIENRARDLHDEDADDYVS